MASRPDGQLPEPYRVRVVHDLERCGLATWWNRLPQPQRATMLRWEYLSTWADAFLPGAARLHIPVVYSGSTPVAALPLYRTGRALRSLANDAHSDVFDAGCDPAHPGAYDTLVAHLLRHRTCLERLDGASPLLAGLRRAAPPMIVDPAQSPWIQLPTTSDAMLGQLSSKFRAGVRRAERALATLGTVTLRDHRWGDPEFERAFSALLELEAASWKGTRGDAITARSETLRFYRRLAVDGPARRWARVAVLRLDDRVVAAQLDLEHDVVRTGLKMASTADLGRRQSPGTVLLWQVVRDCIGRGLTRLELGGELEGWKRHWATTGADRASVRTWPRTLSGQLTFVAREQVKQAVRPLRESVGSRQGTGGS